MSLRLTPKAHRKNSVVISISGTTKRCSVSGTESPPFPREVFSDAIRVLACRLHQGIARSK